jgi:hypothetical protein
MQDSAILNIAAIANVNGLIIRAHYRIEPNAHLVTRIDLTNNCCRICNKVLASKAWA